MHHPVALGLGIASRCMDDELLEVWYPVVFGGSCGPLIREIATVLALDTAPDCARIDIDGKALSSLADLCGNHDRLTEAAIVQRLANSNTKVQAVLLNRDGAIRGVADAYLKLHLLSLRLALPNTLNLDGIFAALPNIAWTSEGPCRLEQLPMKRLEARLRGQTLQVNSVDKFPRMTDYVMPDGVRIADASRVRLGAYLGHGVTIMHEGFVNFNAGARGPGMIEGRLSQGVLMGEDSDLGGGASTMGTLSGGGNTVISIGRQCLVSANAGIGISLGDRCTVEAGLYITAGMPVEVLDEHRKFITTVRARELSGGSDMLFIRNATTGRVECRTNSRAISLNPELHDSQ